jgi:trans-aconitate methyltransferase
MSDNQWTEESSALYRQLAMIAVPNRAEQIATLLMLIPFGVDDTFRVVELASGEGLLSCAILSAFPKSTLTALDGSETMRQTTSQRLSTFRDRVLVDEFDMRSPDWHSHLDNANVVVSSLCVHHLDGSEKQILFKIVRERMADRGGFLMADLVQAQRPEANALFGATWDQSAREQSLDQMGSDEVYQRLFVAEKWNYYHYPDPLDIPSTLFDQLRWLDEAGFNGVDCFWMRAGHAVFGGYKGESQSATRLTYDAALKIAHDVLNTA